MMKGISLPINTIVIVSVAALVLVVVTTVFTSIFGGGISTISDQDAWSRGCSMAIARGCDSVVDFRDAGLDQGLYIPQYDPMGNDPKDATTGLSDCSQTEVSDGTYDNCDDDTLYMACQKIYGGAQPEYCKIKCCGS